MKVGDILKVHLIFGNQSGQGEVVMVSPNNRSIAIKGDNLPCPDGFAVHAQHGKVMLMSQKICPNIYEDIMTGNEYELTPSTPQKITRSSVGSAPEK